VKSEPKAFASLSSGLLARKGAARPAMRPQGFGQGGGNLDDLGWNDMGHDAPPRPALATVGDDGVVPHIARNPLAGLTPVSPVHDQQAEIQERFSAFAPDESEEGEEEEEPQHFAGSFASLTGARDEPEEEREEEETLELVQELPPVVSARPIIMPAAPVLAVASAPAPSLVVAPTSEPVIAAVPAPAPVRVEAKAPRSEPVARGKAAFTLRLDPARHLKLRLACAVTGRSAQQLVTRALDELLESMPELEAMAQRAPVERVSKGE